jgi:hypothetical protein
MNWVLDCIYCISFMKVVGMSLSLHFCGAFSKFFVSFQKTSYMLTEVLNLSPA